MDHVAVVFDNWETVLKAEPELHHIRFGGEGLYILDESEAALSPTRQLALLARIHELAGRRSQFIIATHSPIVMAYPASIIYLLTDKAITQVRYEKTDHYAVTKEFLINHDVMLKVILGG